MARLAIIGASGHGKVVADIALSSGEWDEIAFFDDAYPSIQKVECWNIFGNTECYIERVSEFDGVTVAIGSNNIRLGIIRKLESENCNNIVTLIHPNATVCASAHIGAGTIVMAGAVVNPYSRIGKGCIVNSSSVVEHDCSLANGVHVSPGAIIAGGVSLGECSWIGAGAVLIQQVKIGRDVTIGAGSCVIRDIANAGVYIGSPASKVN